MAQPQTIARNTCRTVKSDDAPTFELITTPHQQHKRALELIGQIKP